MIRWCAYCQRYKGEVEPLDDYAMTHTICVDCEATGAFAAPRSEHLDAIRAFYGRVALSAMRGEITPRQVVAEGTALGIDPVDLMLGVLQPLLHQIGERWARSEVSVAEEHRFSAVCGEVIQSVLESDAHSETVRRTPTPTALLVAAVDNHHVLGQRKHEVLLLRRGVPVQAIYPGLPASEIVALVNALGPRVVGLSAALPAHVESAQAVAAALDRSERTPRPVVTVGGIALRGPEPIAVDPPLVICRDADAFVAIVESTRTD